MASVSPGFGATHVDVAKAWRNAERSFRETHNLPEDHPLTDNALTFWPGDEAIVISYETEGPATASVEDTARLLAAYDLTCGRITMPYANLVAADRGKYIDMARKVITAAGMSRAQTPSASTPAPGPAPAATPAPVPALR
ncbi:hypothetical protein ACFRDV_22300 [Streptomyces fagopyri]|uniref:hypothetical protein n=1 Tax=Streptomyces fagopyri TaxID=2662397 RepID=UPI0036C82A08